MRWRPTSQSPIPGCWSGNDSQGGSIVLTGSHPNNQGKKTQNSNAKISNMLSLTVTTASQKIIKLATTFFFHSSATQSNRMILRVQNYSLLSIIPFHSLSDLFRGSAHRAKDIFIGRVKIVFLSLHGLA